MVEEERANSMSTFVVGRQLLLIGRHHSALPLWPGDNAVHRLFELFHRDDLLVPASGEDGCFVHEVREVGAAEARRGLREHRHEHVVGDGLALCWQRGWLRGLTSGASRMTSGRSAGRRARVRMSGRFSRITSRSCRYRTSHLHQDLVRVCSRHRGCREAGAALRPTRRFVPEHDAGPFFFLRRTGRGPARRQRRQHFDEFDVDAEEGFSASPPRRSREGFAGAGGPTRGPLRNRAPRAAIFSGTSVTQTTPQSSSSLIHARYVASHRHLAEEQTGSLCRSHRLRIRALCLPHDQHKKEARRNGSTFRSSPSHVRPTVILTRDDANAFDERERHALSVVGFRCRCSSPLNLDYRVSLFVLSA